MDDAQNAALRAPFKADQIGKLPRVTCGACRDSRSKVCDKHQKGRCKECGAWITSAHIHLDYVGHAATTDRLREVDSEWNWEPFAVDEDGLPKIRIRGTTASLWIRLTVAGVTRPGVGTAGSDKPDVEKELIGDALRNAAMRFGVALDLWSKEDLLAAEDDATARQPAKSEPLPPDEQPTSKGNTRRGPRVLEGWADIDEQRKAHDAYGEKLQAAPEDVRQALKAWKDEKGYGWPMPASELQETEAQLGVLLSGLTVEDVEEHCPTCDSVISEENPKVDLEHCQMCEEM